MSKLKERWIRFNLWLDRLFHNDDTTYEEWKRMTSEPDEIHFKAASWWAKFLLKDQGIVPTSDDSPMGLALRSTGRDQIHDGGYGLDTAAVFSHYLGYGIAQAEQERGRAYVSHDYNPDPILKQALEDVGIENSVGLFPKKAKMWVEDGEVKVSVGRPVKPEVIYP